MNNSYLYNQFKDLTQTELNDQFLNACKDGSLDKVKYLLTSPDLKYHANIHSYDDYYDPEIENSPTPQDEGLINACFCGHLDIVKYLLTSSELSEHVDINTGTGSPLVNACYKGHLDVVKYLLTSDDLNERADTNYNKSLIIHAYQGYLGSNNLEVMKYLLTSPELEKRADIHTDNDHIFKSCVFKNDMVGLNFLISQINIDITDEIKIYLDKDENKNIKSLFQAREMTKELEKELQCGIINNNKNRIKI